MITPVILCGGSGTRLWPRSRAVMPKPFLPLVGDKTLFEATLHRAADPAIFAAYCACTMRAVTALHVFVFECDAAFAHLVSTGAHLPRFLLWAKHSLAKFVLFIYFCIYFCIYFLYRAFVLCADRWVFVSYRLYLLLLFVC